MPLQTCVSLCVIVSWQAGATPKEKPHLLSGAKEGQSARVFPSAPPGQPAKAASVPTLRSRSNPTVTLTLNSHQSAIVPKVWQHQLTTTGKSLLARELPKRRRLSRSPPLSVSGSTGAIGRHTQTFKSLIHLPRAIRLASRNSDPSGGNLAKCASNH